MAKPVSKKKIYTKKGTEETCEIGKAKNSLCENKETSCENNCKD